MESRYLAKGLSSYHRVPDPTVNRQPGSVVAGLQGAIVTASYMQAARKAVMPTQLRETLTKSMCMKLRSFRKDGTPVDTPVWIIPVDENYGCYTDDRTFKYKRLRRNPKVEVAACDVWGLRSTPWYAAECRIVEEEPRRQKIFGLLKQKYGIHYLMSLWGSLLTDRVRHRVVLEFLIDESKPIAE